VLLFKFVNRWSAIESKSFTSVPVGEQNVASHRWSLLNVCGSLRQKDSQEKLQASACFSQPDVLGQASSSLAQLFSPSTLRIHLGCSSWRRLGFFASQQVTLAATRISGHLKKCLMLNCSSEIDSFVMSRAFGL